MEKSSRAGRRTCAASAGSWRAASPSAWRPLDERAAARCMRRRQPIRRSPSTRARVRSSFRPAAARRLRRPARGCRLGELLDAPDGKAIGSLVTNCICEVGGAVHGIAHPSPEFQALERGRKAHGMCSGPGPDGSKCHAIVGGTGRFAGARRYVERAVVTQSTRHDVIQFVVTLAV